jgi:Mg-chelatase subunit ChlD
VRYLFVQKARTVAPVKLFAVALLAALIYVPHQAQTARLSAQESAPNPGLLTNRSPADVTLGPVDWIFVIDTSASMSGVGAGAADIFPRVRETLRQFVPEIRDGDSLAIFVFDVTSHPILKMQIRSDSDRNSIGPLINNLVARGARTHTGAALTDSLNEVYSRQDKGRPAAIILLTDGHEDVKGIQNPIRIPDTIKLIRDEDVPYVFYVSLGTEPDPQLLEFLNRINEKAMAHGKAFNDPRAENLFQVVEACRIAMKEPRFQLEIHPANLDLPRLRPGGQGGPYSIDISSNKAAKLRLTMVNLPPGYSIEGLPETVDVGPEKIQRVQFTVKVGEGASEGEQGYKIRIAPPHELDPNPTDIQVKAIIQWAWWEWVWQWLIDWWWWLLVLALLIAALIYFLRQWYIYYKSPWEVVMNLFPSAPRSAVLDTPEGAISLEQPIITLGQGGVRLKKSTATINIHREGDRHRVIVEKGFVEVMVKLGLSKLLLESGHDRRLEHNDRLIMPGYHRPSVYLNSSRKR